MLDTLAIVVDTLRAEYNCDQAEAHNSGECRDENNQCQHLTLEDYWDFNAVVEISQDSFGFFNITSITNKEA